MKGKEDVNVTSHRQERGGARWIHGINAVQRRLEVRPQSVIEMHMLRRPSGRLARLARMAEGRIPLRYGDAEHLRRLTGTAAHQGVAARTGPFQYQALEAAVTSPRGGVLLLDQVQDPRNFGALLRTASAAGVGVVVIPRQGSVGVTPTVEKAAAGAVNDVAVCRVSNLARALRWVRGQGFWRVGLAPAG
ncbi:MAG: hypothetical protein A3J75_03800, partial [Acidobacteria bacterium RBG_16_68_9]